MLARVLVVDDDPSTLRLLRAILAPDGHEVSLAGDAEQALDAISDRVPDLVVLDLGLPGMGGLELLERLKTEVPTRLIPVVVVTGVDERTARLEAIDLGADEFLTKPVDRAELRTRVRALLRLKHHVDQLERTENVLVTMARTVEARDPDLREHCERMSQWVTLVGREFGLDEDDLRTLSLGAYLHDIGKIAIPDSVLLKPGPLNGPERTIVRSHPIVGESILKPLTSVDDVLPLVRHHHEHLDGSGYPDGLAGQDIALKVRILSACDVFDALTTHRPYRTALSFGQAVEVLSAEVRRGWWDAEVVACLARSTVPMV